MSYYKAYLNNSPVKLWVSSFAVYAIRPTIVTFTTDPEQACYLFANQLQYISLIADNVQFIKKEDQEFTPIIVIE